MMREHRDHWSPGPRMAIGSFIAILLMLNAFITLSNASTATIGIDWGEEFVEVSIAFRGHKPDILLNDTGSRKFVNAVYLGGSTRFFDQKAAATLIKNPTKTLHKSAHILGQCLNATGRQGLTVVPTDDVLHAFHANGVSFDWAYTPYDFATDGDGQLHLKVTKDDFMEVEELIGHFFSYIKDIVIAKLKSAKVIKHDENNATIMAVISIPCNYTQKQRKAIVFAAESAGIAVVQLVHGITAASTIRAFEQEPGSKRVLFYDLGSSGANVGVIEIHVPTKDAKGTNPINETQINVLSCVHQRGVGGRYHDVALAEHLKNVFENTTKIELMPHHPHAMQKLLKAANKAKVALTISDTTTVTIEGLIRSTDLPKVIVTRDMFNKIIRNSILQLQDPINKALQMAGGLRLADLDGVELIGGAWRVPAVQEKLAQFVRPQSLGFHLNAEEAVAMGSGYLAAAHNPFFKMKSATIIDNSVHMYAIRIASIEEKHPGAIEKKTPLFKPEAKLQGSKSIVFKTNLDFKVELTENDKIIAEYQITGITDVMNKEENIQKLAQVTVVFRVDERGIIGIAKSSAQIVDKETQETPKPEEEKSTETPSNKNDDTNNTEESETKEGEKEERKPVYINITVLMTSKDPFSEDKLAAAKKSIEELRQRDIDITKRSESKNALESLIYKYKSAANQKEFQEACDGESLDNIKDTLKTFEDWFDEESYTANLQQFEEHIDKLQAMALPIYKRWRDNEARPALVASTNKIMLQLETVMQNTIKNKPYCAEKIDIIDKFNEVQRWWDDVQKEQETRLPHQEPAFTSESIMLKVDIAREAIAVLERIQPPKPKREPDDKGRQNEQMEEQEQTNEQRKQTHSEQDQQENFNEQYEKHSIKDDEL